MGCYKAGLELFRWYDVMVPYACFYKLGVVLVLSLTGRTLIKRALFLGVYPRAPDFQKLSTSSKYPLRNMYQIMDFFTMAMQSKLRTIFGVYHIQNNRVS